MATDRVIVPPDLSVVSLPDLQSLRHRLIESKRDIEMQFGSQRNRRVDPVWRERAVLALGHIEKELARVKRAMLGSKKPSIMPLFADFFERFAANNRVPPDLKESATTIVTAIRQHYAE